MCFVFEGTIDSRTAVITESIMLNNRAYQNPSTWKPRSRFDAIIIIEALITIRKSPNVSIVSGMVNRISRGFTMVLSKPISSAVTRAVKKVSIFTPGSIYDVIITAMVDNNILSGKRINSVIFGKRFSGTKIVINRI
jgi:hypothetical protein